MRPLIQRLYTNLTLCILLLPAALHAQAADTLKVLFVGNSYTYFWNLPQTVSAMAESQGKAILTRQSTAGGVTLKQHWEGDKNLNTRALISQGGWDVVVLQNHSLSSLETPDEFRDYGRRFIELIRKTGATPMLYITWARESNPLMQTAITQAYEALASQTGVKAVPVGQIWKQVRALRPELNLFDPDGSHPSPIGTYLSAAVFYGVLSGTKTDPLPHRIFTTDRNGEKLYLSIMDLEDAEFMQQLVDEALFTTEQLRK